MLNSKETELSVLGTVMYSPELFTRAASVLTPDDFFYPGNAAVYSAMVELFESGLDINIKTVWNSLYKRGHTGITESEINDMLSYRVDATAFVAFVTQLSEFSGYRLLESGVKKIDNAIKKGDSDLSDYTTMLASLIHQVSSKDVQKEFSSGDALVSSYMEMVTRERTSLKYTGLESIDSRLVDFDAKEISYLAARPGVGKSAMLLQSVRSNLEIGASVGFLSMEMSVPKLMNRLVSSKIEVNGEELLKRKELTDDVKEALMWYSEMPLFLDDSGPFTVNTVIQKIRKLVYEHGCDVVYIDYIGLIGGTAGATRNDQLSTISRELKNVSSELDIPLVIAAQLNREVVKRGGTPNLADLRDSGSLEQDASIVAFMYPDIASIAEIANIDAYLKDQVEVPVKFEVAKQRNGPVFVRDLMFYKEFGKFALRDEVLSTF